MSRAARNPSSTSCPSRSPAPRRWRWAPLAAHAAGYGLFTYGNYGHDATLGVDHVGIDGTGNPYTGDTKCTAKRPILCLKVDNSPRPNYAVTPGQEFYQGWTLGHYTTTLPVKGSQIISSADGDNRCATAFGTGWRMAEFHDGGYVPGMDASNFGNTIGSLAAWPGPSRASAATRHGAMATSAPTRATGSTSTTSRPIAGTREIAAPRGRGSRGRMAYSGVGYAIRPSRMGTAPGPGAARAARLPLGDAPVDVGRRLGARAQQGHGAGRCRRRDARHGQPGDEFGVDLLQVRDRAPSPDRCGRRAAAPRLEPIHAELVARLPVPGPRPRADRRC